MKFFREVQEIVGLLRSAGVDARLSPPAPERELADICDRFPGLASHDLLDLYRVTAGESPSPGEVGAGLLLGFELLTPTRLFQAVDLWEKTAAYWKKNADSDPLVYHSSPDGAVRPVLFADGWVPFAFSGSNYMAIDLAPGPRGMVGQIINFGRDDEVKFVIANDVQGLLDLTLSRYLSRRWHPVFQSPWSLYDALLRERCDGVPPRG